ncbi:MAG: hypothetical protein ACLSVD_00610 [Eggerthellaceae bacterium]
MDSPLYWSQRDHSSYPCCRNRQAVDLHMLQGILQRVVDTISSGTSCPMACSIRHAALGRASTYNAQPPSAAETAQRARHACADHDGVCIERFSNIGVAIGSRDFEAPFTGSDCAVSAPSNAPPFAPSLFSAAGKQAASVPIAPAADRTAPFKSHDDSVP